MMGHSVRTLNDCAAEISACAPDASALSFGPFSPGGAHPGVGSISPVLGLYTADPSGEKYGG